MRNYRKKGTNMNHKGRSPKTLSDRVFARRAAAAAAGLFVAVAVVLAVGASSGRAEGAACVLTIKHAEAQYIHATRAILAMGEGESSETVHYTLEYATSKEGPWSTARSGTSELRFSKKTGLYVAAQVEVHHLSPETQYFGRVIVENGCTTALERFEFKTTAVEAPEIINLKIRQNESLTAVGLEYADYEAEIENNGAKETKYQFEIKKASEPAWPEKPAPGTDTSGTVTEAEDFVEAKAHITGLTAETKYELRVVATNEKNLPPVTPAEASESFTTASHDPEAFMSDFSNVGVTSVQLHGSVRPRSSQTTWRFEYATSEGGPWSEGPNGVVIAADADENYHQVEGELVGLKAATVYYVRLHAENGFAPATSRVVSIETAGPPIVLTFAAHTYVPGGEAIRVLGSVQPHGYDTHYRFQYELAGEGVEPFSHATFTPEGDAGSGAYGSEPGTSGFPAVIFGEELPGLQAAQSYRYRLVASSSQGTMYGAARTLRVPVPAPGAEPACANESLRSGLSAHLPDCRAYELVTPAEKEGSMDNWTYSGSIHSPVAVGEDGQHAMVHAQFSRWGTNVDAENTSYFFSREESRGWQMTSATPQPQAAQNSYQPTLFNADLTQIGLAVGSGSNAENSSPNLELLAGTPGGPYTLVMTAPRSSEPKWVAASHDFGTLILSKAGKLYEWTSGAPVLIDKCAARIATPSGGGVPGGGVSEDGSRVFFEAAPGCSGESHLYMRVDHEKNVDLGAYKFLAANAQRSQLLVQEQSGETYEYLLYNVESKAAKLLFSAHSSLNLFASRDLSAIYFISGERLTPEAPPLSYKSEDAGDLPVELYRYDASGLHFIVQTDGETVGGIFVSPDGRYFYWSSGAVTAVFRETDKQHEFGPGNFEQGTQAYRYDSVENVVQCMSCASSFKPRPELMATFLPEDVEHSVDGVPAQMVASEDGDYVFFESASQLVRQDVDGELYAGTGFTPGEEHSFYYSPSSDVYEWRKDGVDGCAHVQGCLALISSGTGGYKNVLLGTSPAYVDGKKVEGANVFFATHSQLVGQDTDNQGDVYDARIGGGFPPPASPAPECAGDACLSPSTAPIDTTPASLSFSGPGNPAPVSAPKPKVKVKPCGKGMVRKKGRCVKRKLRKRAKHSSRARRAVEHGRGRRK